MRRFPYLWSTAVTTAIEGGSEEIAFSLLDVEYLDRDLI